MSLFTIYCLLSVRPMESFDLIMPNLKPEIKLILDYSSDF